MTKVAIRVDRLRKRYRIGRKQHYRTLRESLTSGLQAPIRTFKRLGGAAASIEQTETFWALRDISFEVPPGQVMGIIGPNGAGKSTLLKILSRVTQPTEGLVDLHGRVASLLEVGTGFHPELTGRENIYLNGSILGMRRVEIVHKFDEIVAFAEIEKFLDTPVKHYSSGMYMRLAFAVAAHLETGILLVDEVLAVGDAAFQRKCLGRMEEIGHAGKTVLFVSHSMSAIQRLCSRVLLIANGVCVFDGSPDIAIQHYLASSDGRAHQYSAQPNSNTPSITNAEAHWTDSHDLRLAVRFASPFPLMPPVLGIVLTDIVGTPIFGTNPRFDTQHELPNSMQSGLISVNIATEPLRPSTYYVSLYLGDQHTDYVALDRILRVDVGHQLNNSLAPPVQIIGSTSLGATWRYENSD